MMHNQDSIGNIGRFFRHGYAAGRRKRKSCMCSKLSLRTDFLIRSVMIYGGVLEGELTYATMRIMADVDPERGMSITSSLG
jgi:hypothetical protein